MKHSIVNHIAFINNKALELKSELKVSTDKYHVYPAFNT